MSLLVFSLVILSAILHAVWNLIIKKNTHVKANMLAVVIGHLPPAGIFLALFGLPNSESFPHLMFSVFLHLGYFWCFMTAYNNGEFSKIYPIARGSAPLIVLIISVLFLGVQISSINIVGIVLISLGILLLGIKAKRGYKGLNLAILTGLFTALYSINDSIGVVKSGNALLYFSLLSVAVPMLFAFFMAIYEPKNFQLVFTENKKSIIIGGNTGFFSYVIILWAFSQANVAEVAALRETSILFGLLIGALLLKERITIKILSAGVTVCLGIIILRLS